MAIIQLAIDHQTKSQCIIKIPRLDTEHSHKLNIEKLEKEAEYLQKSDHQNIVKFIDQFIGPNRLFNLVVEYVDGNDLLSPFNRTPAEEQRAIKWVVQILDALDYIHRSGVVHRDLNPGNIMLNREDDVVVIDFGTIKDSGYSSNTVYTKPGFEPPEVISRSYADERSDIYGVGSILLYLLTCQRPSFIGGQDLVDLLSSRGISQRTIKCVAQALQLEPAFRFQTASVMRSAILGG